MTAVLGKKLHSKFGASHQARVWSWKHATKPAENPVNIIIMPPAKRVKSSAGLRSQSASGRPTAGDLEGNSEFATLAKQHWLKSSKRATRVKVKNDVLKQEIWDTLEKEGFPVKSLLSLESLQILERYNHRNIPVYSIGHANM